MEAIVSFVADVHRSANISGDDDAAIIPGLYGGTAACMPGKQFRRRQRRARMRTGLELPIRRLGFEMGAA